MIAVVPQSVKTPTPKPAMAWAVGAPAGRQAHEEEVPAAGVLLAAQQPRAGQESPRRTKDHQRHGDLEDGEATHGLELGSGPEKRAHRLVRAVGGGQGVALGRGLYRS